MGKDVKEDNVSKPMPPVRANLETSAQLAAWRERLKSEGTGHSSIQTGASLPEHVSYYSFYGPSRVQYNQLQGPYTFDHKSKRDSVFPMHSRKELGILSDRPVRASQLYGRGKVIDDPRLWGNRRVSVTDSFKDRSHL